ncbi:MAG: DUF4446 family protein [Chloroflexota bacterium]
MACATLAVTRNGGPPIDLDALLGPFLAPIVVGLTVVSIALFLVVIGLWRRTVRLSRRIHGLTRGTDGRPLEAILEAHLEKVFAVSRSVDDLGQRTRHLERQGLLAIQRMGLVRFNPFEDTGGNQSVALALLDANGDGVILSSLHARSGTRVYAKAVTGGRAEGAVSDEEAAALRSALEPPPSGSRPAV